MTRSATQAFLSRHKDLFEGRVIKGKIKDCHGDLKTEHVYLATPIQIIDCIEFNDRFRFGDISADLAFLTMDLDYKGRPELSEALINRFLAHYDDPELLVLMAFYKCYRAMVRVKVLFFQIQQTPHRDHRKALLQQEARRYLNLAYQYAAQFTRPTLFIVCGLPASGKSTLASALSCALGLRVISSDITRKALFQSAPDQPHVNDYGSGIYSENATALTYGKLLLLAQEEVCKGDSVVIDATYSRKSHRLELVRFARDMDINLVFAHCNARTETLKKRLRARDLLPGVSDARLQHLERLVKRFEPLDEIDPQICIEIQAEISVKENLKKVLAQGTAGF